MGIRENQPSSVSLPLIHPFAKQQGVPSAGCTFSPPLGYSLPEVFCLSRLKGKSYDLSNLPFFTDSDYHHTYLYLWKWQCFLVSMPESYSIIKPYPFLYPLISLSCVLSLLSSLRIGDAAALHALGRVVSKSVYFWSILEIGEAMSYFQSNFFL